MQKKCYEYYSNHPVGSIKLCMKGVRFEIIVCDHPQLLPPPFAKFKQHLQAKLSVVDKIQNAAGFGITLFSIQF